MVRRNFIIGTLFRIVKFTLANTCLEAQMAMMANELRARGRVACSYPPRSCARPRLPLTRYPAISCHLQAKDPKQQRASSVIPKGTDCL